MNFFGISGSKRTLYCFVNLKYSIDSRYHFYLIYLARSFINTLQSPDLIAISSESVSPTHVTIFSSTEKILE